MSTLLVKRKGYSRRAYTRRDGTRIKETTVGPSTYRTPDKGKAGRTPESEQWFEPGVHTGWKKEQSEPIRRGKVLKAHKGNVLSSARSMQALANVSTDRDTAKKASEDADYFYGLHQRQPSVKRRTLRITPRMTRLR